MLKLKTLLHPHNADLVFDFLVAEAKDFKMEDHTAQAFAHKRIEDIEKGIKKNVKAQYLTLISSSNMGEPVRQLTIGIRSPHWEFNSGSITVSLCPCGKDEHWGAVRYGKQGID